MSKLRPSQEKKLKHATFKTGGQTERNRNARLIRHLKNQPNDSQAESALGTTKKDKSKSIKPMYFHGVSPANPLGNTRKEIALKAFINTVRKQSKFVSKRRPNRKVVKVGKLGDNLDAAEISAFKDTLG